MSEQVKIRIKNTPEQIELIRAMASKDRTKAIEARETFAKFIGPIVQQVLDLMATSSLIYVDWPYNEDDDPSFPLDMYFQAPVNHVHVWQQNMAGGLGTSLVTGLQELKLHTYRLDSAVSLLEKNVRRGRLPYVSLALNRMAQEVLRKQERNAWLVILKALGEAQTGSNKHVIAANTANVLQVHDLNQLLTRSKRINVAFNDGTPDQMYSKGATDLFVSPEAMEQVRSFAYQPMNTRAVPNTDESTAVPLPDSVREKVYTSPDVQEIYGLSLHEMLEFGISQDYNTLFEAHISGTINGPGGSAFATATDEILVGIDMSRDGLIRPVAQNADTGATFEAQVDDQWVTRSGKLGWFGSLEEGRVCLDSRTCTGIVM